jgi:hypothetical protein
LNPVNVGDIKLVLEEDGTEVDQDYLPFIEANTILMLLSTNELWSDRKGFNIFFNYVVLVYFIK